MTQPPILGYASHLRISWRERPWNRWVKIAVPLTVLAFTAAGINLLCSARWLIRPSSMELVRLICFAILLATMVVNVLAVSSSARHRGAQRGLVFAILALVFTLPSCCLVTALLGPAAEVGPWRFENATRDNQRAIARAIQAYVEEHNAFPPHLAVLVASGAVTPNELLDPFSRTTPATIPAGLAPADWRSIVPEIDRHSDLIYTGGDLPSTFDDKLIILYDKPDAERNGRIVSFLFFDTHFVASSDLPAAFAAHNSARAALLLTAQTLDIPPPPPPLIPAIR